MADLRIGLDYTAAIHQSAGIGRYVRELARALVAHRPHLDWRLFIAEGSGEHTVFPHNENVHCCPSILSERNHARLWHRLRLPVPVELWTGPLDLFHATDFTLPPVLPRTRSVLTIHDLAFERYPTETMPGMQRFLSTAVPRSVRRADHIIAVSEATEADLVELYNTPPEKIATIPHGVDPRFHPQGRLGEGAAIRDRYSLPDGPLVLTVGTLQPRKNHLRLVQAMAQVREQATLVIAGGRGWAYEAVHAEIKRLKLTDRVILTGFVDDTDLPALYRTATVFAYPAMYEGFGLPALEAMASGVPVVAANSSSLPEVVGEVGLLVDPLDVDAIAIALDNLLGDAGLRAALRVKGIARAGRFTWARAAELVWEVYEAVLQSRERVISPKGRMN